MFKKLMAAIAGIFIAVFAAAALYIYDSGFAVLQVSEDHHSFMIPIPLAAVEVGGVLLVTQCPDEEFQEVVRQCRKILPAVLTQLEETSDVTLVDIVDGPDSVKIEKLKNNLCVSIESSTQMVQIRAPVHTLTRIVRRILLASGSDTGQKQYGS